MPVIQVNIWTCEVCWKTVTTTNDEMPYDDPLIYIPDGENWEYIGDPPNERLACPECIKKMEGGSENIENN